MTVAQSCSWCHEINALLPCGPTYCRSCGHRAELPRLQCDCPQCTPPSRPPPPREPGRGKGA